MSRSSHRLPDAELEVMKAVWQSNTPISTSNLKAVLDRERPWNAVSYTHLVLTFNGEIYNFQSLKEDLIQAGHTFANHSDSEVLLHSYEEYGPEFVKKLRGMFSFVIWDKNNRTLFGARDPFGIKPMYYCLLYTSATPASPASRARTATATALRLNLTTMSRDRPAMGWTN